MVGGVGGEVSDVGWRGRVGGTSAPMRSPATAPRTPDSSGGCGLTAAIWHNDNTGQPVKRSLLAYDH